MVVEVVEERRWRRVGECCFFFVAMIGEEEMFASSVG